MSEIQREEKTKTKDLPDTYSLMKKAISTIENVEEKMERGSSDQEVDLIHRQWLPLFRNRIMDWVVVMTDFKNAKLLSDQEIEEIRAEISALSTSVELVSDEKEPEQSRKEELIKAFKNIGLKIIEKSSENLKNQQGL